MFASNMSLNEFSRNFHDAIGSYMVDVGRIEDLVSTPRYESPFVYWQETSSLTRRMENDATSCIKTVIQNAVFEDELDGYVGVYGLCTIPRLDGARFETVVRAFDGVYRKMKNTEKIVGYGVTNQYPKMSVGKTIVNVHELAFFAMCPDAFERYMKDASLCINHCIIDETGCVRYEMNPFYMELVPRGLNTLHGQFIKKWGMYGVPVSARDVNRLDNEFEAQLAKEGLDYPDATFKVMMRTYLNALYRRMYPDHKFTAFSEADAKALFGKLLFL